MMTQQANFLTMNCYLAGTKYKQTEAYPSGLRGHSVCTLYSQLTVMYSKFTSHIGIKRQWKVSKYVEKHRSQIPMYP